MIDQRGSKPAAVGKLVDDCVGDCLDGAVDQDLVVWRAVSVSPCAG